MKLGPVTPARIDFDADGTPFAPDYADLYHPVQGALGQARHVFLGGNGLPARWAQRTRFVVLETGFGLGNNFLATWAAWRDDPARCDRLDYVAVEKHPLAADDLRRVHAASPLAPLALQLQAQWPPATPDWHRLEFEGGRVRLTLCLGDVNAVLPEIQAEVDAFYLDGFAPTRNADMWTPTVFERMNRLAAPGATAATWSTARATRDGLQRAGFAVERAPGFGHKREMTVAVHAPRHRASAPVAFVRPTAAVRQAMVIGAGLAGAAAAWALSREGWACTVLESADAAATGASSNAAGLFHASFNAPDSLHARWFRSAALRTQALAQAALASGDVAGQLAGVVRLDGALDDDRARQSLAAVGLPHSVVRWLDRAAASAACGLALPSGGFHFGAGGWLAPAALVHWLLAQAHAQLMGRAAVARLRRVGPNWHALDADDRVMAEAPVVVLANAMKSRELLAPIDTPPLMLQALRGQTTLLPAQGPGVQGPQLPVSGRGYAIAIDAQRLLCGATSQADDDDARLRPADHRFNLAQARSLGVLDAAAEADLLTRLGTLDGRVGWRASTPDRLPLVGPVVALGALAAARAGAARLDAARHLPRQCDEAGGLYVLTGLGSRGLTSALPAAEMLAAWISGRPMPVPASLRDALDPARQALRLPTR